MPRGKKKSQTEEVNVQTATAAPERTIALAAIPHLSFHPSTAAPVPGRKTLPK